MANYLMLPDQSIDDQLTPSEIILAEARTNARRNVARAANFAAAPRYTTNPRITTNADERHTHTRPISNPAYAVSAPDASSYTATINLSGSIWPEANHPHPSTHRSYTQTSGTWRAQDVAINAATSVDECRSTIIPTRSPLSHTTCRLPPSIEVTHSTSAYDNRPQDQNFYSSHLPVSAICSRGLLSPNLYTMSLEQAQPQTSDIPVQHVPVSPVSHHSGVASRGHSPVYQDPQHMSAESGRKRSFSQIDQQLQDSPRESNGSMNNATSPGAMYVDDSRPAQRVTRTIKRPEAPTNAEGKYICDVSADCAQLVFDRKCEWSKHMDKHDRPYRCPNPSCAKLQGFTYSGGLLRHEREVHNKHGGPRAFLMCPHPNCKRHTEKGFTRKENLQEHLRRVHAGKEDPSQAQDAGAVNPDMETPGSALSNGDQDEYYSAKRANGQDQAEVDTLRAQVEQLRAENDAKNALIHQLEHDVQSQNDRLLQLEDALRRTQQ